MVVFIIVIILVGKLPEPIHIFAAHLFLVKLFCTTINHIRSRQKLWSFLEHSSHATINSTVIMYTFNHFVERSSWGYFTSSQFPISLFSSQVASLCMFSARIYHLQFDSSVHIGSFDEDKVHHFHSLSDFLSTLSFEFSFPIFAAVTPYCSSYKTKSFNEQCFGLIVCWRCKATVWQLTSAFSHQWQGLINFSSLYWSIIGLQWFQISRTTFCISRSFGWAYTTLISEDEQCNSSIAPLWYEQQLPLFLSFLSRTSVSVVKRNETL